MFYGWMNLLAEDVDVDEWINLTTGEHVWKPVPDDGRPASAPHWKPAPPPRFKDANAIQACLNKIMARPIRHQAAMYRINRIAGYFKRLGSIEQDDWFFLGGTAASLRGTKVTTDMI